MVGHLVAAAGDGQLAEALIADDAARERVDPDQLTVHADRGAAMTCKTVTQLLADLKIGRSHSRPKTSNDDPYIEASFKTLKYDPAFPDRFGSIQHARQHCEQFYSYYNHEHRHSGIGLHTPAAVQHGTPDRSASSGNAPSTPPGPYIPNGSAAAVPVCPACRTGHGSTNPTIATRSGHHPARDHVTSSTKLDKIKKLPHWTWLVPGVTQGHCVFGGRPLELGLSKCLAYVEAVGAGEIT